MDKKNLVNTGEASKSSMRKMGWGYIVLGVITHALFGSILMFAYVAYLRTQIDNLDFTYVPLSIGMWFWNTILPYLIVTSFLLFFFLRKKVKFVRVLIIGCVIELIFAALLPISDEYRQLNNQRYQQIQIDKIAVERSTLLPTINNIENCSKIQSFTVWKECVQKNMMTKDDFKICMGQEWGQFHDTKEFYDSVAEAEYYSRDNRQRACQEIYNPIGAASARTIEDCFDIVGPAAIICFAQTIQSDNDYRTCKSLSNQPSEYNGYRRCDCNETWAIYQKDITSCADSSCPLSLKINCMNAVVPDLNIVTAYEQCSQLTTADLRHYCSIPALTKIKNNPELQREYNNTIGKDLCSLLDQAYPTYDGPARQYCNARPK